VPAEAVAAKIRQDPYGGVWGAVAEFGISYRHACAIRAGWRGAGRIEPPIPYRGRHMDSGQLHGWMSMRELRVIKGGKDEVDRWTRQGGLSSA